MTGVHQVAGAAATAAYHASIARAEEGADGTVRHGLRPEIGDGTIEVTPLPSGFHLVRYDVAFAGGHRLRYAFPGDHFELEHCVEGRLHISEADTGTGELCAGAVALSPRCATDGAVEHRDGERYRAVSVTGSWSGLETYLADRGAGGLPATGPEQLARARYLAGSSALHQVARPLEEIFVHRRSSPGRPLYLESRLAAAFAALVDGLTAGATAARTRDIGLAEHEVAALRRVPDLLWRRRHTPPTSAELARASSMSVRRLTTGFRALYGASVREFHRRRCLDRAAALLVETDWPVSRIAHEVGYASAGNFGYAFRRDRGITPARFRRAHT
ncbi:helix-turn-helix transcriptional regulator [Streptomyces cacaoi]|uniref:helix-turn-helix transcriptional regulator n=1 Tax=Streptomyces cacaoi TaxID=1898 RepID=UPI0011F313C9|nr:AraC family transcriptional regulator [Streptomyces cacaoi]